MNLQYLGLPTHMAPPVAKPRQMLFEGRVAYEASLPAPLAAAPGPAGCVSYKEAAHNILVHATCQLINAIERANAMSRVMEATALKTP